MVICLTLGKFDIKGRVVFDEGLICHPQEPAANGHQVVRLGVKGECPAGFWIPVVKQATPVRRDVIGCDFRHAVETPLATPVNEASQDVLPAADRSLAAVAHPHRLQELVSQDFGIGKVHINFL